MHVSVLAAVTVSGIIMKACQVEILLLVLTATFDGNNAYQINRQPNRKGIFERRFKRLKDHEDPPPSVLETSTITTTPFLRFEKKPLQQQQQQQQPQQQQQQPFQVTTIHQLQSFILDEQKELNKLDINKNYFIATEQKEEGQEIVESLLNHDVLELMKSRFQENSKPGARNDDSKLALALEGGGMRGAVSAGMAAAIAALGLTDTIDAIYGSSAGSVIGAYMISRQMCMDVYVDILPAAKKKFVCKRRMIRSIATDLINVFSSALKKSNMNFNLNINNNNNNNNNNQGPTVLPTKTLSSAPGMNISFILDGIMGEDHGIRPLDMEKFRENNAKQQLRVVSSCIDSQDNMYSKCFGTEDFFDDTAAKRADGKRNGLFACLEASVTVPGATGPPVELKTKDSDEILPCFDAFCFEPLPYRSAVEEGATHVLVLCSRPEGFVPKTKPGAYEKGVAPWYFRSHGHEKVAQFFEAGGQQYIYAEDMLLLEHGKTSMSKVPVPPPEVLYGAPRSPKTQSLIENRDQQWKSAHLLPMKVPLGTPELATLEQDEDTVLEAVRGGFAAAFDILAPIVGLPEGSISGAEAARLVFPDRSTESAREALETKLHVPGDSILDASELFPGIGSVAFKGGSDSTRHNEKSHTLLMSLPGFRDGRLGHLAKDLAKSAFR